MNTDFDITKNKDLFAPVVFRSGFNRGDSVDVNQAWSLFFSAGQEDKTLGSQPALGSLFTNLLIAIAVTGSLWALFFSNAL